MPYDLSKTDHSALQSTVWQMVIDEIPQNDQPLRKAAESVVRLLEENRDGSLFTTPGVLHDRIEQELSPLQLSNEDKFRLSDIVSLLVHTGRSASIIAADREQGTASADRMVAALKKRGFTPSRILSHIGRVEMVNVFTAHPTYIGDLDYAKTLRRLDTAIISEDEPLMRSTIRELLTDNSLVADRFKVQDETVNMRHYLKNVYRSMPDIYRAFDHAMDKAGLGEHYDPFDLRLNLRFASWGSSGDKDGNRNVTSQSTRDAIFTHRETIANAYNEDMQRLLGLMPESDPMTAEFRTQFLSISKRITQIKTHATVIGSSILQAPEGGFIAATLTDMQRFLKEVYSWSHAHEGLENVAQEALDLHRKTEIFGFHLGQIEYRETAAENQYVLDHVIPLKIIREALPRHGHKADRYSDLEPEQKETVLNYVLDNFGQKQLDQWLSEADTEVPSNAQSRRFEYADSGKGKDNFGIYYHTIERLRLAERNPDMVRGQVLAEAESPVQVKEMLLLLKATGNDRRMRIIPLFEDPDVLARLDDTLQKLNQDPHIFAQQIEVSLQEWEDKASHGLVRTLDPDVTQKIRALPGLLPDMDAMRKAESAIDQQLMSQRGQDDKGRAYLLHDIVKSQIQLAHSDNARRGGTAGARSAIYKAHQVARRQALDIGVGIQFYEGGSHTDSFRMGVRSYRSLVNLYNNHDYMKCTVQGMDLAQLFSNPKTIEHFVLDNIANAADVLQERATPIGRLTEQSREFYRRRATMDIDALIQPVIDQVDEYRSQYFGSESQPNVMLGNLIAQVFDYKENRDSGTLGSRASSRSGKKDTMDVYLNPVKDTRTIGYSETFQHRRLNPNLIGAGNLRQTLLDNGFVKEGSHTKPIFTKIMGETPPDAKLNRLYQDSPVLRDAIDRTGYAVAATDFELVWNHAMYDYSHGNREARVLHRGVDGTAGDEHVHARPAVSELPALAATKDSSIAGMLAWLEVEYREAARMVIEAIGKEKVDLDSITTRELTIKTRSLLPMYEQQLNQQDVVMEVAEFLRNTTPAEERELAINKMHNALNKVNHNMRDMATLMRPPLQVELFNQRHKAVPVAEASTARGVG